MVRQNDQPPLACSLGPSGARDQAALWQELLKRAAVAVDRPALATVDWTLTDDADDLVEVVRLAQAEKACCPFLDLRFVIEADAVHLLITAPPEAASLLDHLAGQ